VNLHSSLFTCAFKHNEDIFETTSLHGVTFCEMTDKNLPNLNPVSLM